MSLQLGMTFQPQSTIRFRVHDVRLGSSSSWSLQTRANTNDAYVTHRESGAHVHASFHHSGVSHYTLSREAMMENALGSQYFLQTDKQNLVAPDFHHAHQIIIPYSELSLTYRERVRTREYIDVPISMGSDALNLNLYLSGSEESFAIIRKGLLVAQLILGGGGIARLVAQPSKQDGPVHNTFRPLIEEPSRALILKGWKGEARTVIVLRDDQVVGTKYELEVRLQLPE